MKNHVGTEAALHGSAPPNWTPTSITEDLMKPVVLVLNVTPRLKALVSLYHPLWSLSSIRWRRLCRLLPTPLGQVCLAIAIFGLLSHTLSVQNNIT